ncbi:hypothetical protein D1781_01920 [Amnibacterium setariae]|uniref:YCII-related domain-containing protein n=1 Tax=Amnibacterium setariae TaxID=2306585 RepID=A0A3A1UAQ7_9MICO|nr:hypothetical protein D1781_01920 [Amnibacterium setariae]
MTPVPPRPAASRESPRLSSSGVLVRRRGDATEGARDEVHDPDLDGRGRPEAVGGGRVRVRRRAPGGLRRAAADRRAGRRQRARSRGRDGDRDAPGRGPLHAGPFTEGVEVVGGYYVVDVASKDRAIEIAGMLAETRFSPVEIRRLMH